jgi:pyridoxamine 5'-phosphate oxidase
MDIADLRLIYAKSGLLEADANPDPVEQFRVWFAQALAASLPEANAMALATVDRHRRPDNRMVLLKQFDETGFVFYTNYRSRKAADMDYNPNVSALFYWSELERQVRIGGRVKKTSKSESDAYFASRPRGHQLGAWASEQSTSVEDRDSLEAQLAAVEEKFRDMPVPRPPYWGGYRLKPDVIEFWQGRPNRLHDRLQYDRTASGWIMKRLSP